MKGGREIRDDAKSNGTPVRAISPEPFNGPSKYILIKTLSHAQKKPASPHTARLLILHQVLRVMHLRDLSVAGWGGGGIICWGCGGGCALVCRLYSLSRDGCELRRGVVTEKSGVNRLFRWNVFDLRVGFV